MVQFICILALLQRLRNRTKLNKKNLQSPQEMRKHRKGLRYVKKCTVELAVDFLNCTKKKR